MSPGFPRTPFLLAAVCLLTFLAAPPLMAQTGGASTGLENLSRESRDYFLPGELPAGAGSYRALGAKAGSLATLAAATGGFPVKSTVAYQSFDGMTYTMNAYGGRYVMWLLPDSAMGGTTGLTEAEIRKLVSLSDLFYARLTTLIGGEPPAPEVLLPIALTCNLCGGVGGLGKVGTKGVEIDPGQLAQIKLFLAKDLLAGVVPHEMVHNFDIYSAPRSYIDYYSDFSHAWTDFAQLYMQTYDRSGYLDLTPDAALSLNYKNFVGPWDAAGPSASWATCVRNGGGCEGMNIEANEAWAGFLIRYAKLHGPSVIKKAFEYLKGYKAQNQPEPPTPEDKNDLLVEALAYGANANVSCELDAWNWAVSSSLRTSLAQQYPAQNPFCVDKDADGYSRAQGDFNDGVKAIHPGATEVPNGVDDDCNDLVDDLLVAETEGGDFPNPQPVAYPGRIAGTTTTGDVDSFTFNLASPRKFVFNFCSKSDFNGFILMYKPGGVLFDFQSVAAGQCLNRVMDFNLAGDYRIDVQPNTHAGDYTAEYSDLKPWPAAWGATSAPALLNGSYKLTSTTLSLAGAYRTPTHVKFWVEGFGFVGTVAYASPASFNWTPPAGTLSGNYGYRAVPFYVNVPAEAETASRAFNVTIPPKLAGLIVNPTTAVGGNNVAGKVTLDAPAPAGGTVVTLTDTNAAATVPVSVTVPAGALSKTFTITTTPVTAVTSGYVTAKLGAVTKSVLLKVRPIGVKSLTLTPNPVTGPNNVTGTVTLERPAAPAGITVTLSSSNAPVAHPTVTTITIPAGTTSKTFTVATADVTVGSSAVIKATANAISKSVTLKVN